MAKEGDVASEDPKFICDDHCGRLARWLRFVGYDCLHDQHELDSHLLRKAADENRVILTRDGRLVAKILARRAILLESYDPLAQLLQVLQSFSLIVERDRMFTRCTVCNQVTEAVDASAVWTSLPPHIQRTKSEFRLCLSCGRIYWSGTHVERMLEKLRAARLIV